MLYMGRTEHLQADESIHCEEVAEADAVTTPWALLAWIRSVPGDNPAWRLVGTYASETAALTARRRLSRRLGSATSARPPLEPLQ